MDVPLLICEGKVFDQLSFNYVFAVLHVMTIAYCKTAVTPVH